VKKKRVIVLCGVSGVGKTWKRTNDWELRGLPFVDVKDIYRQYEVEDQIPNWESVTDDAIDEVKALLAENQQVVLEGYFLRGSGSRRMVFANLQRDESQVDFIDLEAPLPLCIGRIEAQRASKEITENDAQNRIDMARRCFKTSKEFKS